MLMPIAVNCFCGQVYHVREEFAGKPVQCVGCGRIVTVPPASVTPAQASSGPRLSYPEAPPILLALPVEQPVPAAAPASILPIVLASLLLVLLGGGAFFITFNFDR